MSGLFYISPRIIFCWLNKQLSRYKKSKFEQKNHWSEKTYYCVAPSEHSARIRRRIEPETPLDSQCSVANQSTIIAPVESRSPVSCVWKKRFDGGHAYRISIAHLVPKAGPCIPGRMPIASSLLRSDRKLINRKTAIALMPGKSIMARSQYFDLCVVTADRRSIIDKFKHLHCIYNVNKSLSKSLISISINAD